MASSTIIIFDHRASPLLFSLQQLITMHGSADTRTRGECNVIYTGECSRDPVQYKLIWVIIHFSGAKS